MFSKVFYFIDRLILGTVKKVSVPLARLSLFVVFFWFGALKVFGMSPANPLVAQLLTKTLPFISFEQFIIGFGIYEMIIGIFFLLPRYERIAIFLLIPHMVTTCLPLFLLPTVTWTRALVPTMEGQYIIKNLAIIATALALASRLHPHYRS